MARKFEGGLQDSVLEKINVFKVKKYVDILDKAIIAESNQANHNRYSDWKEKKGRVLICMKGSTRDLAPTCLEYGKKHREVFYQATRAFFKCEKMGHMMRDCPMFGQQKGNRPAASSVSSTPATKTAARPTTTRDNVRQGKVFALILGDV
ncbi:hypothetical protein ACSBR2_023126 [Camellia fascicularis]